MNKIIKNGLVGAFEGYFVYCNEKESPRTGFLFKCCKGCIHNPIKNETLRLS